MIEVVYLTVLEPHTIYNLRTLKQNRTSYVVTHYSWQTNTKFE